MVIVPPEMLSGIIRQHKASCSTRLSPLVCGVNFVNRFALIRSNPVFGRFDQH
jgi:hypothetical protein